MRVAACYVDVRHPTPADALAELPGRCVAVPMFLAAGYHVRVDVPAQLAATGRGDVLLAETFGPDPALVAAAADRLRAAGLRDGRRRRAGRRRLQRPPRAGRRGHRGAPAGAGARAPVTLATIAMGGPRVAEAVVRLRADGAERVAVASWLLAPGLFQRALVASGADLVAEPMANHEAVAQLVVARYPAALANRTSVAQRPRRRVSLFTTASPLLATVQSPVSPR